MGNREILRGSPVGLLPVLLCRWQVGVGHGELCPVLSTLCCVCGFAVCQNCIELDAATISGILVADIIATVLLAIAVYCITGQDSGRLLRGEMGGSLCPAWGRGVSAAPCRDRECLVISTNTRVKDGWSDRTRCAVSLGSFHHTHPHDAGLVPGAPT